MNLTQIEEEFLDEMDKLIDFYLENNPEQKTVTVTEKQFKKFQRIKKKTEGEVYRKIGQLDLKNGKYRGFDLLTIKMRRNRRKKDNIDMWSDI